MPAAATHPRGWVEPLKGKDRMHQQATRISNKKVSTLRRDLTLLKHTNPLDAGSNPSKQTVIFFR